MGHWCPWPDLPTASYPPPPPCTDNALSKQHWVVYKQPLKYYWVQCPEACVSQANNVLSKQHQMLFPQLFVFLLLFVRWG